MKRNHILLLTALLVLSLCLSACGSQEAPETTAPAAAPAETAAPAPLEMSEWTLSASTWSSPNGATVHLRATPSRQAKAANFIIRLEGEETANIPCQWNGTEYSASADLNAANGYCYYLLLNDYDGTALEVGLNTPTDPRDETLINMADALASYCSLTVEESTMSDGKLIITGGTAQVQAPKITDDGQTITCKEALLILSFNGEKIAKETLNLTETDVIGAYEATLPHISFDLPELESDQQLQMQMEVTLSNGQILSAPGGTWYYGDTGLMAAVG